MVESNADLSDPSLDELIDCIVRVLLSQEQKNLERKSKTAKRNCKQKPWKGFFVSTIKSVGEKMSDFHENNSKVVVEVLDIIGKCHWAAVGFVLVASVLEKLDTVKQNRKECVRLLKSMYYLAKIVKELQPIPHQTANMKATIKESLYTILKGAMSCWKIIKTDRLRKSKDNKEELLELRQEIEEFHKRLDTEINLCNLKLLGEMNDEKKGRKRSVRDAEPENEEDSNKRSHLA